MPRAVRTQKTLTDLVVEGGFRADRHQGHLGAHDLPISPPHSGASPAMVRIWARLRANQSEFRQVSGADLRLALAREFAKTMNEYREAVEHSGLNPTEDVTGITDLLASTRLARA